MFRKILVGAILTIGAGTLITSCETISEDQCLAANWADRGYSDGTEGKARSKLNDYIDACSKYGADVNRQRYLDGYESGLTLYCTYDKGFARGENGNDYTSVCDGPRAADFRRGYEDGTRSYCTYDRGFNRGEDGSSAKSQCGGSGMEAYQRGYDDGRVKYEYEREYDNLLDSVRDAERDHNDMIERLKDTTLSSDERFRLEKKLRRFKDRLKDAKYDLYKFERKRGY